MNRRLNKAEINHLRRLLGWVRCEIGASPEEMVKIVQGLRTIISDADEVGRARLIEAHRRAEAVPKYVRAAVKSLDKFMLEHSDVIYDGESMRQVRLAQEPSALPAPDRGGE